jgi:ElaB/YqjD/DUF883 family membrane-anchored ribosome-binding protein
MLNDTPTIRQRLVAADREHQREAGGKLLFRSVKYLCGGVAGLFAVDVILHLNAGWRLGLILALAAGVGVLGIICWRRAFVRRNRLEHIARFLETRQPALGSRLINLLQLSEQSQDPALEPLSRQLAAQAVQDYAAGLSAVDMASLARTGELRRHGGRALLALLIFGLLLAAMYHIAGIELARFADPFGDHPPYSFTRLQIVQPGPAGTNVLYDKGIVVRVKAGGHQPREVYLTAFPPGHPEQAMTLPMFDHGPAGYDQLLGNVRGELIVFAHTKDQVSVSKQVRVGVILTPQLEQAYVRVAPPAYTGIQPQEKPYVFKDTQALEGSEVKFRLQSNRPLRAGTLELMMGDQPAARVALKKSGEQEVSGAFMASESGRMRFALTDVDGLPSQGDLEGALTVTHDLPPTVAIVNPEHDAMVAMDFKLEVQIEAADDYGLREIRLHRGLNGVFSAPKVYAYTNIVRASREVFPLDFAKLGVEPGEVIALYAEAEDNAPLPHLARSQMIRLQIISVEDYNNLLRAQMDIADAEAKYAGLNDELQDLRRQQEELGEKVQELGRQLAGAGRKDTNALAQQFDRLIAQQNELNAKLERQAERMENFVREHPVYDVEQDLQKVLRQQAAAIRESIRADDQATRELAQRTSPAGGPRRLSPDVLIDFKKASDNQVTRLEGVGENTEKEVVQKLDDMDQMQELVKDFNQFTALYRAQQDLTEQVQVYNRAGTPEREDQLALKDLAATENQVADYLGQLQDKLRADAQSAQKLFPKAAKSGHDLADQISKHRLQPLAAQATEQMLLANGEQAYGMAERLRQEMEQMFAQGQASGGNCPGGDELDNYLRLQRMDPGQNFAQMSRCRKFGFGFGASRGMQGEGRAGSSGYAMTDGSSPPVLGNESSARAGSQAARQASRFGRGAGALAGHASGETEKPDAMKNLNPVNRQSAAVASETVVDQYNEVVENYFKAITTRKEKPADANQN